MDQSAIVLMNRKTKTERAVTAFVPVCSRVTGMPLHHSQGTNQAQAQISRRFAQSYSTHSSHSTSHTASHNLLSCKK
jgi:hypothetical protein